MNMFKKQFDKLIGENNSSPRVIRPMDTAFSQEVFGSTLKIAGV